MLSVLIFSAQAQEMRLNTYAGYAMDDNLSAHYNYDEYVNGTVKGGLQYGGGLEFVNSNELGFELLYLGQNTTLPINFDAKFVYGPRSAKTDFNMNYALVGVNKYSKQPGGMMEGYGGIMLGCLFSNATVTNITDSALNRYTGASSNGARFTWGLKLGSNIWLNKNVAVKLQAQLLSTIDAVGGSGYYGSYYGYYSYMAMWQFSFSTGLVFKFGNKAQ